jgi:lysophospholipase L1-like esterase
MHVPRLGLRRAAALAAAALVGLGLSAGPAAASDGWKQHKPFDYYLALGDSLAAGFQPTSPPTFLSGKGYADDIAAHFAARGTQYVNLACPGETTGSMIHGGCPYPHSYADQLDAATAFLWAHRDAHILVTIDIGANDVDGCVTPSGSLDVQCGLNGIHQTATDLPVIMGALRAAAGPRTEFIGSTYYNPFLASWLTGPSGQATAELSSSFSVLFNGVFQTEYPLFGFRVADVAGAFSSSDFTDTRHLAPGVTVPKNVARICEWTWMCAPAPIGPNIHANDTGYEVMADAFQAKI